MQNDERNGDGAVQPEDCPRFNTCNAAVCPIDPKWHRALHLNGEQVCYYLRSSGKQGAEDRFQDDPIFAACVARLPEVAAKFSDIRRRIEKAGKTGFRKSNLPARRASPPTTGEIT